MSTSIAKERRTVQYKSLQELVADAEQLAAVPHETVGNWTFVQILWHLTESMNASFDGYQFRANWLVRKIVAPMIKKSLLTKPMKPGYPTPKVALSRMPTDGLSSEQALDDLRSAVARFEQETPTGFHPLFGHMTPEEWNALHLRHAELHMSFVRAVES